MIQGTLYVAVGQLAGLGSLLLASHVGVGAQKSVARTSFLLKERASEPSSKCRRDYFVCSPILGIERVSSWPQSAFSIDPGKQYHCH
jgi:hypothetical protein